MYNIDSIYVVFEEYWLVMLQSLGKVNFYFVYIEQKDIYLQSAPV